MIKEILGDVYNIIAQAAPIVASALGGSHANIATKFTLSLLSHAFNVPTPEPAVIAEAIKNTSNAVDILKELEGKFSGLILSINQIKMPSHLELTVKVDWVD